MVGGCVVVGTWWVVWGVVLISTAARMYDVRQLQLGSAAGSSPGRLSSPTGCCFDAVRHRVFGRFVCVGGVYGLKMVVSLLRYRVSGVKVCVAVRERGIYRCFQQRHRVFVQKVCVGVVWGAGCVERRM